MPKEKITYLVYHGHTTFIYTPESVDRSHLQMQDGEDKTPLIELMSTGRQSRSGMGQVGVFTSAQSIAGQPESVNPNVNQGVKTMNQALGNHESPCQRA